LARIAGVDLPKNKRVVIGLTSIFGIGKSTAEKILKQAGISLDTKVSNLTDDEVNQLRTIITSEYKTEGSLKSEVQANIKRLMDIGSYKGKRHRRGLPVKLRRKYILIQMV
jgi:small subunit ribosomal protein S13